jgi:hypothetical protein
MNAHPITTAVIEGAAVVFVEKKLTIRAGINRDGERAVDFFVYVLFDGAERKNGPFADEERKRLDIGGAFDFAATV